MPLKDLIIDQKRITEDLLEKILKGNVELIKETEGVNLAKESQGFSSKTKTLLYLCGRRAWELINKRENKLKTSISELVQSLGIQNSTMRSILKELKDDGLVFSEKGKYFILPKGIILLQNLIEDEAKKEGSVVYTQKKSGKKIRKIIGRPNIVQKFKDNPLPLDYVEDMLPVLEKSKHQDRYLLALYIAQEKMEIEGLTPSEINIFLTEPPLKLPKLYTANISRDLGKKLRRFATPYKTEGGSGFEYRLTSFGEKRAKNLIDKIQKELKEK